MVSDLASRRRLVSQHLVGSSIAAPAEVVSQLGAVQAQDYAGAKWAVAMRMRGKVTDQIVEDAVSDGSIIRTHVLRPTWHFVAPADVRWMLELTAPRIKAVMAYYGRQVGLDAAVYKRSNAAITRALRGGNQLTRAELAEVLRKARIDVTGQYRLGRVVMNAELDALICSGARRGKQFTYALLDERAPSAKRMDRDQALAELAKRYFATRSPATPGDFAWWSGLTIGDATKAIELAGRSLVRESVDGRAYWSTASTRRPRRIAAPIAHLLPNYDEYFIGYKDRSGIGRRLKSSALVTGGNALIGNVIVIDGELVGAWKRRLAPGRVIVELRPMTRLTDRERQAIEAAARYYADFLKLRLEIAVPPPG